MKIAIYPGSFDPITNGHIDVIERAAKVFDKVYVVIGINSKKSSLFTQEERLEMVQTSLAHEDSVDVAFHSGLIVDYAVSVGATAIIRGLRSVTDFEYEMQIALMNRKMQPELQTVFLMPHEKYTYLNSSIIREIARYKQNVSEFVPKVVEQKLKEKFGY
ncbi:MAG: pantetheine-phosphate adenylyltransferase [Candidatus Kapaibacterium sp.]|jgi:pantetheine-phosphate adenylyltransferase|nr:pantetheine-phosphate adenylyltransferase [Ignavibacteriota bacterium]